MVRCLGSVCRKSGEKDITGRVLFCEVVFEYRRSFQTVPYFVFQFEVGVVGRVKLELI